MRSKSYPTEPWDFVAGIHNYSIYTSAQQIIIAMSQHFVCPNFHLKKIPFNRLLTSHLDL